MPRARLGFAIGLAAALGAAPALAHRLNVFAWIEGETVVVEAKFSNGNRARSGTIQIFDGGDRLLRTLPMGPDGTARFPLAGAEEGLRIEMSTGDGHDDYWILTPADIEARHDAAAD